MILNCRAHYYTNDNIIRCKWCFYNYILSSDELQCIFNINPINCEVAAYDPKNNTKIICIYCSQGYALNRIDNICISTNIIQNCLYM